jgi:hypothetical protein
VALCKLSQKVTIAAGTTVTVNETGPGVIKAVTMPAGSYYLEGAGGLLDTLCSAMTADATLNGTYSYAIDDDTDSGTGKVTISAAGITTFTITWTASTPLRDALGYTGTLTPGALSFQSTKASPLLWLPNTNRVPESPDPAAGQSLGREEYDYQVAVAPSGAIATSVYETRYVDVLAWMTTKGSKTWRANEVIGNESFQGWLAFYMQSGAQKFRFHPDRSADATYSELVLDQDAHEFKATPMVQGWVGPNSLWSIRYNVRKAV